MREPAGAVQLAGLSFLLLDLDWGLDSQHWLLRGSNMPAAGSETCLSPNHMSQVLVENLFL